MQVKVWDHQVQPTDLRERQLFASQRQQWPRVEAWWSSLSPERRDASLVIKAEDVLSQEQAGNPEASCTSQQNSHRAAGPAAAAFKVGYQRLRDTGSWKAWQMAPAAPQFGALSSFRSHIPELLDAELRAYWPGNFDQLVVGRAYQAMMQIIFQLNGQPRADIGRLLAPDWDHNHDPNKGMIRVNQSGVDVNAVAALLHSILASLHQSGYNQLALSIEKPLMTLLELQLGTSSSSSELSLEDLRLLLAIDAAEVCNWVFSIFNGWQSVQIKHQFEAMGTKYGDTMFVIGRDGSLKVKAEWAEKVEHDSKTGVKALTHHDAHPLLTWILDQHMPYMTRVQQDFAPKLDGRVAATPEGLLSCLEAALQEMQSMKLKAKEGRRILEAVFRARLHLLDVTSQLDAWLQEHSGPTLTQASLSIAYVMAELKREQFLCQAKLTLLQAFSQDQAAGLPAELPKALLPAFDWEEIPVQDAVQAFSAQGSEPFAKLKQMLQGWSAEVAELISSYEIRSEQLDVAMAYDARHEQRADDQAVCTSVADAVNGFVKKLKPKLISMEVQAELCKLLQQQVHRCEKQFGKAEAQLYPLLVELECVACDNPEALVADQLLLPMLRKRLCAAAEAQNHSLVAAAEAAAAEILQSEEEAATKQRQAQVKAAAKKAKKQAQKAKKQLLLSLVDPEHQFQGEDAAPAGATAAALEALQLASHSTGAAEASHESAAPLTSPAGQKEADASWLEDAVTASTKTMHDLPDSDETADFLQNLITCPITKRFMVDPVIAADGHTYERSAIEEWLLHNTTSQVTRAKLAHKRVVPNYSVKSIIASLSPIKV